MDETRLSEYRSRLERDLTALSEDDALGLEDRRTVALDQQSVGRLSRLDAIQRQAMAQATARRRDQERRRIEAALARIADGEFGYCEACGEEIAIRRLDLDPAVARCVSCATGR